MYSFYNDISFFYYYYMTNDHYNQYVFFLNFKNIFKYNNIEMLYKLKII